MPAGLGMVMPGALMERKAQRGTNRVPTRNDSDRCTAAHRTKASTVVGTPWRGLGWRKFAVWSWQLGVKDCGSLSAMRVSHGKSQG